MIEYELEGKTQLPNKTSAKKELKKGNKIFCVTRAGIPGKLYYPEDIETIEELEEYIASFKKWGNLVLEGSGKPKTLYYTYDR